VEAGDPDFPRVHGIEDAGHEADAGAVAQFGEGKTQFADFAQHGAAIGVPVGIPAGGKGIHVTRSEYGSDGEPQFITPWPCEKAGWTPVRDRHPAADKLQVGVAGGQHGGKPGRFFLAAPALARLFKMPVAAHDFQRTFAVDFFLQSPQGLFDGLAFFQFNFGQTLSLPLCTTWGGTAIMAGLPA
jgi:hypothetical protein